MIPAGGSGKLTARVTTKPGLTTRITKSISVQTNAPDAENLRLGVTFETYVPIAVTPAHRIYVNTLEGTAATERVRLHRMDGEVLDARLESTALPPGVTVRIDRVEDEPGMASGDLWLDVTADGSSVIVNHSGTITLGTNDPAAPVLQVPLVIRVRPTIDVRPIPVQLWPPDGGPDRTTRLVRLAQGARTPFEITAIEIDDPAMIHAEAVSQGAQQIHSVRVSLVDGITVDRAMQTSVRITTTDPAKPVIAVPVQIHPRNQAVRRPVGPGATAGATAPGQAGGE